MNICRYCDKAIEGQSVRTLSYWQSISFLCHPECKQAGERAEAIECQTIDADCNDCRHFQRGQILVKGVMHGGAVSGQCLKFNKETRAFPKKWTGHECFEHRRLSA